MEKVFSIEDPSGNTMELHRNDSRALPFTLSIESYATGSVTFIDLSAEQAKSLQAALHIPVEGVTLTRAEAAVINEGYLVDGQHFTSMRDAAHYAQRKGVGQVYAVELHERLSAAWILDQ